MPAHPHDSGSSSAQTGKKRRVGLSAYQEERLKRELRATTPSEPWVEAQFKTAEDQDRDGSPIIYRYHDSHVFPPGGLKTAMVLCPVCGVFVPPNIIEHGCCMDHGNHRGWGPSPSAVAIQALQMFNLRLEAPELWPEDTASLRREIDAFEQSQNRTANRF